MTRLILLFLSGLFVIFSLQAQELDIEFLTQEITPEIALNLETRLQQAVDQNNAEEQFEIADSLRLYSERVKGENSSDNALAMWFCGNALLQLGKYSDALLYLNKASLIVEEINLQGYLPPCAPYIYFNLGQALLINSEINTAKRSFKNAINTFIWLNDTTNEFYYLANKEFQTINLLDDKNVKLFEEEEIQLNTLREDLIEFGRLQENDRKKYALFKLNDQFNTLFSNINKNRNIDYLTLEDKIWLTFHFGALHSNEGNSQKAIEFYKQGLSLCDSSLYYSNHYLKKSFLTLLSFEYSKNLSYMISSDYLLRAIALSSKIEGINSLNTISLLALLHKNQNNLSQKQESIKTAYFTQKLFLSKPISERNLTTSENLFVIWGEIADFYANYNLDEATNYAMKCLEYPTYPSSKLQQIAKTIMYANGSNRDGDVQMLLEQYNTQRTKIKDTSTVDFLRAEYYFLIATKDILDKSGIPYSFSSLSTDYLTLIKKLVYKMEHSSNEQEKKECLRMSIHLNAFLISSYWRRGAILKDSSNIIWAKSYYSEFSKSFIYSKQLSEDFSENNNLTYNSQATYILAKFDYIFFNNPNYLIWYMDLLQSEMEISNYVVSKFSLEHFKSTKLLFDQIRSIASVSLDCTLITNIFEGVIQFQNFLINNGLTRIVDVKNKSYREYITTTRNIKNDLLKAYLNNDVIEVSTLKSQLVDIDRAFLAKLKLDKDQIFKVPEMDEIKKVIQADNSDLICFSATPYWEQSILQTNDILISAFTLSDTLRWDKLNQFGKSKAKYNLGSYDSLSYITDLVESNNKKEIYFTSDGFLSQINFNALKLANGKYLVEDYKLKQLSSVSNLVYGNRDISNKSIRFFGGIDYNLNGHNEIKQDYNQSFSLLNSLERGVKSNLGKSESWSYLPGTLTEIEDISSIYKAQKLEYQITKSKDATEEAFKALDGASPKVLHIATHGYFYENKKDNSSIPFELNTPSYSIAEDPLIRSGLIMAGANEAWTNGWNGEGEDGILTAYEIANMDLSNTNLVVLSACETARGDIDASDGVYGLQRAFKLAGVDYIIMSLWSVPDKETSEFMTKFYTYWLGGKEINDAFRQTQLDMIALYRDQPEKWAAFILVN